MTGAFKMSYVSLVFLHCSQLRNVVVQSVGESKRTYSRSVLVYMGGVWGHGGLEAARGIGVALVVALALHI